MVAGLLSGAASKAAARAVQAAGLLSKAAAKAAAGTAAQPRRSEVAAALLSAASNKAAKAAADQGTAFCLLSAAAVKAATSSGVVGARSSALLPDVDPQVREVADARVVAAAAQLLRGAAAKAVERAESGETGFGAGAAAEAVLLESKNTAEV